MDELTLDGQTYISSKQAAKITGYAKDYVGQLCREGRVSARLVGRNWYVLEDSIREHRFGPSEATQAANVPVEANSEAPAAWEPSRYNPEAANELPVIEKPFIEEPIAALIVTEEPVLEDTKPSRDTSEVVKEMQSAWQDWFTRRNEQKLVEETLEEGLAEGSEAAEAHESDQEIVALLPDFTAVNLQRHVNPIETIEEEAEEAEEEEIVPIHRSYARPEPVAREVLPHLSRPQVQFAPAEPVRPVVSPLRALKATPEAHVVHERRIKPKKRASLILKAFFIAIILIVVAVTVIGSGYLDTYSRRDLSKYSPIQYLVGERVVTK